MNLIFLTITSLRRESWRSLQCRGREGESVFFRGECLPQIEESLWMQSSRGRAGNYTATGCYFSPSPLENLSFFGGGLLLFLPNNRHYSCKALLVSTLDFINASHPKGCNAHRLPAAFAPLSHIHWEYELMAAPVWAEASRFISRPSTLLLYSIKFLSLFAFASPLTSGGRSAQRRKRMN